MMVPRDFKHVPNLVMLFQAAIGRRLDGESGWHSPISTKFILVKLTE